MASRAIDRHWQRGIYFLRNVTRNPPNTANGARGARAQLRAELNAAAPMRGFGRNTPTTAPLRWASLAAALAIVVFAISQHARSNKTADTYLTAQIVPNSQLTPGATRPVRLADICQQDDDNLDPAVSPTIQKAVFQEYGMDNVPAQNYQIDYLINPQLGGTGDIRNLWPEPYGTTIWNAHAKDALEDRLHQMVCQQQIDLASAQHEIASDWIAAYKKYFRTLRPL